MNVKFAPSDPGSMGRTQEKTETDRHVSTMNFCSFKFMWTLHHFSLGSYSHQDDYSRSFSFPRTAGSGSYKWCLELTTDSSSDEEIETTLYLRMISRSRLYGSVLPAPKYVPVECFVSVVYASKTFPERRVRRRIELDSPVDIWLDKLPLTAADKSDSLWINVELRVPGLDKGNPRYTYD